MGDPTSDPRRQRPIEITWHGWIGTLRIDSVLSGAVESSEVLPVMREACREIAKRLSNEMAIPAGLPRCSYSRGYKGSPR
jgi:hypothetical protein